MDHRKSRKPAGNSAQKPAPSDVPDEDYAIFPHLDHVKQTLPFRISDYGNAGALSDDQIQTLIERFDLDATLAERLSRLVGYSLDVDSQVSLVKVTRSKAIARASETLEDAAALAKRIEADARKVNQLLAPLSSDFATLECTEEKINQARTIAAEVERATDGYSGAIEAMIYDGNVASIQPDDKRHVRDLRRIHVVESCCYTWQDAGRPLTVTTRSDTNRSDQRDGQLIRLLKDVIEMVTDPATEASGETLRKDIKLVKYRFKMRGDLASN